MNSREQIIKSLAVAFLASAAIAYIVPILHLLQPEGVLSITERFQIPEVKKTIMQLSAIAMLLATFTISIKFEKIHAGIEKYLLVNRLCFRWCRAPRSGAVLQSKKAHLLLLL